MAAPKRQPSTFEATTSILLRLWGIGCLGLLLLFWIPFSALLVYYIAGTQGAIITALVVAGIVWAVAANVRTQRRLWRCTHCNGTFQPFQGTSALCPHCRKTVTPPPTARATVNPSPSPTEARPTRTCPDCAETVLAATRRCRYCGYEFAD
jgi:hypothetical protein